MAKMELLDQDGQVEFDPHTGRCGLYQVIEHEQDMEHLDQDGQVRGFDPHTGRCGLYQVIEHEQDGAS